MTLREEAEKAARETFLRVCKEIGEADEPISPREQRYITAYADTVERVAKARIEVAVRALFEATRIGSAHAPETATLLDPRAKTATNENGEIIGPAYFGGWQLTIDTDRWPLTVDDFVRVALAAAERGE